jgi:hypothetical protein
MHPIARLEHNQVLLYFSIFVVSMFIFTHVLNTTPGIIMGIGFGLAAIHMLYREDANITNRYNIETEYKLHSLRQEFSLNLQYFSWDSNMIHLFYSSKDDLGKMDHRNFRKAVKHTDSMLKCYYAFRQMPDKFLENDYETFQVAEEQYIIALNSIHSIIYNVSSEKPILDKHQDFIQKFRLYSKINLDYMRDQCNRKIKENGLLSTSRIIVDYDLAKPINKFETKQTNFYFFN